MPVRPLAPMLATAGQLDARHEWVVEPKLDGWRALAVPAGEAVAVVGEGQDG